MNIDQMCPEDLIEYLENLNIDINLYQLNINEINNLIECTNKILESERKKLVMYEQTDHSNLITYICVTSIMTYLSILLIVLKLCSDQLSISIPNTLIVTFGCYIKQGINFNNMYNNYIDYSENYYKEKQNKTENINQYKQELSDNLFMLNGATKEKEKVLQKIKTLEKTNQIFD